MDYSPDTTGAAFVGWWIGFLVLYLVVVLIAAAGAYVLSSVALMMLFRKVGIEPWIAWVPYYNQWKLLELGSQPGWMILLALVPGGSIVTLVFLAFAQHRIGISFGKESSWVVLGILLPWLWCFLLAARSEVYDPRRLAAAGYPPPHAGWGSVPPSGFGI